MDAILQLGIELIIFLQSLGEWLLLPMKAFTFMGNEEFYLIVAPVIFWCFDTSLGLRVGLMLMTSSVFNTALKYTFHGPRPYWISDKVQAFSVESSFGAPSGHAMNAVTVWGRLAAGLQRKWFWWVAVIIVFFISISRLYLAVHFPHDTLLGWLFGALLLWGVLVFEKRFTPRLAKMSLTEKILWAFGASLVLLLIGAVSALLLSVKNWQIPSSWITLALQATPGSEPPNPLSLEGLFTSTGTFFGLCLGAIYLFNRGGFETRGPIWQLSLRFLVGLIGVLAIRYGLGALFPEGNSLLSYFLRYVRYAIVGAWVTGGAPFVFIHLKLTKSKSGR